MKINTIVTIVLLLVSNLSNAQWPVSGGSRGTITGTIGELRGNNGGRIHNGTDCTGSNRIVCSIMRDTIDSINLVDENNIGLGNNRNIQMKSGTIYRHVVILPTIAANQNQIDRINDGIRIVDLNQNRNFAEMVVQTFIHVHMETADDSNFITTAGFGAPGFTFLDNSTPIFGPENKAIAFYKDFSTEQEWNNPTRLQDVVTNESYTGNLQPVIIWGNVDVVSNVFQPRINPSGAAAGGHLAPYSMGYSLKNLFSNAVVYENYERIQFDKGYLGVRITAASIINFRKIHSKKSLIDDPFFIISNSFRDGLSTDEYLKTTLYPDGDYEIRVRAKGTPPTGGGTVPQAESTKNVRIDNYKTFIKKVSVTDLSNSNSLVKYLAEWQQSTGLTGDGSIELIVRSNEPFKGGASATIDVMTSEKVPVLNLLLPGSDQLLPMSPNGTDGTSWSRTIDIPNPVNRKVQLRFRSGERIFALALGQVTANVKRQENGNFIDQGQNSTDKNHELKVCPSDSPLTLAVSVPDGQNVTLTVTGGTPPYQYSKDEMPMQPGQNSSFGAGNTFTIDYDRNYVFKVKDAGGCQAEKFYTLPRVPCSTTANAGNQGVDRRRINLGNTAGTVIVDWNMYDIPDTITIDYRGIIWTSGSVSNGGMHPIQHTIQSNLDNFVTVTIDAPLSGTAWEYRVSCPDVLASARISSGGTHASVARKNDKFVVTEKNNNSDGLYTINYRYVGDENWNSITSVKLPHEIVNIGTDIEVLLTRESGILSTQKLKVSPNPSSNLIKLTYQSKKAGSILLSVYSTEGRLLNKKEVEVVEGLNNLDVQTSINNSKLVILKAMQDGETESVKVLIEKQ